MILPWLVGPKKAKEIMLLGIDDMPAEEAARLGGDLFVDLLEFEKP